MRLLSPLRGRRGDRRGARLERVRFGVEWARIGPDRGPVSTPLLRPCSRLEAGSVGLRALMLARESGTPQDQLHFELLASTKLLTELTTLNALLVTVAIWLAEGFAGSALMALVSASTEDLMALVWLGKSLLA